MKNQLNRFPKNLFKMLLIIILINFNLLAFCSAYEFNFFENFSSNKTNFNFNKIHTRINFYNLTIEKNKLNLEYLFNNQNLIGEEINIKILILNENQTEITGLIDTFNINQDNMIYRNLKADLTADLTKNLKGNCSILFTLLPNEEIFLKKYFFINNSLKKSNINENFSNKKDNLIFYFLIFLIFLIIILFIIKNQKKIKKQKRLKNSKSYLK